MRYVSAPSPRCCLPPSPGPAMAKDPAGIRSGKSSSVTSLPPNPNRCAGSLDRRRRRLRNRSERDQRARSHNDLICCDRERLYCSHQQFQYASNPYVNNYNNNTEVGNYSRGFRCFVVKINIDFCSFDRSPLTLRNAARFAD